MVFISVQKQQCRLKLSSINFSLYQICIISVTEHALSNDDGEDDDEGNYNDDGGDIKDEKKEGRKWCLRRFQQLRSFRNEIETLHWEAIPFSSRIIPRFFQFRKDHRHLSTTPHLYIATRPTHL